MLMGFHHNRKEMDMKKLKVGVATARAHVLRRRNPGSR